MWERRMYTCGRTENTITYEPNKKKKEEEKKNGRKK
jgi:hypothetical protein